MSSYQRTYVGAYLEVEAPGRVTVLRGYACENCNYSSSFLNNFCQKCGGSIVKETSTVLMPPCYHDVVEDAYEEFSDELLEVYNSNGKLILIGNIFPLNNPDYFDENSSVCEMTPEKRMRYIAAFSQNYERVLKYISSLVAAGKVTSMQIKFGAVIYYE